MKKSKEKNLLKNSGITLIALVITVIVLLILAGVTITTLTGDNGLLTKANDAKITTTEAEGLENIQLAVMASHDKDGIDTTSLAENLSQINGLTDTNNQEITENTRITLPKNVRLNNSIYKIKKDGMVEKNLLPLEYQEVEYIQTTGTGTYGTQYILPDIIAQTGIETTWKISFQNVTAITQHCGGSRPRKKMLFIIP